MLNFGDAFGFLFKEKNWLLKFLIPLIPIIISMLPITILSVIAGNNVETNALYFKNLPKNGLEFDWRLGNHYSILDSSPLVIFAIVFSIIVGVFSAVIGLWYQYEITQSGIEKRETKPIWKESIFDILKKAGKSFLLTLLYWIVPLIIVLGVACCIAMVAGFGLVEKIGSLNSMPSLYGLFEFTVIGSIAVICISCVIAICLGIYQLLVVQPASLKLIATNTFSEGLKMGHAFKIGTKYFGQFFLATVFIMLISLLLTFPLSLASSIMQLGIQNQAIQIFVVSGFSVLTTIVSLYLTFFASRLVGGLYRAILEKEKE